MLSHAANAMLLNAFRGMRKGVKLAAQLANTLLSRTEAAYDVTLHTTHGRQTTLSVVSTHALVSPVAFSFHAAVFWRSSRKPPSVLRKAVHG